MIRFSQPCIVPYRFLHLTVLLHKVVWSKTVGGEVSRAVTALALPRLSLAWFMGLALVVVHQDYLVNNCQGQSHKPCQLQVGCGGPCTSLGHLSSVPQRLACVRVESAGGHVHGVSACWSLNKNKCIDNLPLCELTLCVHGVVVHRNYA